MIKVGILSFSDGRERVHDTLEPYVTACAQKIEAALQAAQETEVYLEKEIIHNNQLARQTALKIQAMHLDAVVFNIPVFAFPNYALIAAGQLKLPILAIAPVNGQMPGLGGLLAATNLLKQCGYPCEKVWGCIEEQETLEKCMHFLRGAHAATELSGSVCGLIGGRSIGIGTGVAPADRWQMVFGVDIDHVDQSELLRRGALVNEEEVDKAFHWLSDKVQIAYDDKKLTKNSLKQQIRSYIATREIRDQLHCNFLSVKCHYDMSEYYCTQCLSAALFNDPYDWNGTKETCVYSCEADSDGALTMQVFKLLSGKPVLFTDFRHFDEEKGVFYFCNCGAMSTWYAARSDDPDENLKKVTLMPVVEKYGGAGCHVQYIGRGGQMTFGRITHTPEQFCFTVFTGEAEELPKEFLEASCPQWPHLFVKPESDYKEIVQQYDSNHIHGVYGNYVEEVRAFCKIKGIEFKRL